MPLRAVIFGFGVVTAFSALDLTCEKRSCCQINLRLINPGLLMRIARCSPARFAPDRSGSAAVEFAIVAPTLLMVMLGIMAFGSFLGASHSLQAAASDAARAAVAGLDPAERTTLATLAAQRSVASSQLLQPSAVVIDAKPDPDDPDLFTVTLRYDLRTTLLNLPSQVVPMPQTLSRSASIRRGGL